MDGRKRRGPAVALAVFYVLLTVGTIVGFAAFQWRPPLASQEGGFDPGGHGGRT